MINGVNHITIAVTDLSVSFEFYVDVLGMKPHAKWQHGAYLSLNGLWFSLSVDKPAPATDYSHLAFDVSPEHFASMCQKLAKAGVQEWKQNSSEGNSVYFEDPDGHKLELHSGSLQSRLASLKHTPYEGLELFDSEDSHKLFYDN